MPFSADLRSPLKNTISKNTTTVTLTRLCTEYTGGCRRSRGLWLCQGFAQPQAKQKDGLLQLHLRDQVRAEKLVLAGVARAPLEIQTIPTADQVAMGTRSIFV